MLDEKDLQAIAQLIHESEQRMSAKIEASSSQTLKDALEGASLLIDSKLQESEQRMAAQIEQASSQTSKDALQGASALMESYFEPKFKLLAEGIQNLQETQIPRDEFEDLKEEVAFLRTVVRQHSREIEALKHA